MCDKRTSQINSKKEKKRFFYSTKKDENKSNKSNYN